MAAILTRPQCVNASAQYISLLWLGSTEFVDGTQDPSVETIVRQVSHACTRNW